MFIDIKKMPYGVSVFQKTLCLAEEFATFGHIDPDVEAIVTVKRDGSRLFCHLEYTAWVYCDCIRCVREYRQRVSGVTAFHMRSSRDEDTQDDEYDSYEYQCEDDQIPFDHTLYSDIVMVLPAKLLCEENCSGGEYVLSTPEKPEELEESTVPDSRWNGLAKLKK